jgi:hypothetical protein
MAELAAQWSLGKAFAVAASRLFAQIGKHLNNKQA